MGNFNNFFYGIYGSQCIWNMDNWYDFSLLIYQTFQFFNFQTAIIVKRNEFQFGILSLTKAFAMEQYLRDAPFQK